MKLRSIFESLAEALKPSEYRPYVKNWDKSKYEELFRQYTKDRKAYRIYIPLNGEVKKVDPDPEVEQVVKAAGYEIVDYVAGIAEDKSGRQLKIGKILARANASKEVIHTFTVSPKRTASRKAEWYVVISRHPYDLAGMSTDRGWKSCMNLHTGGNRHYVALDVKEGTLIAYLVKADDMNINKPTARVLIKPFVNLDNKDEIAFGIEDRVYGADAAGFTKTVQTWVDQVNKKKNLNGIFDLHGSLYNDGGGIKRKFIGDIGEVGEMLKAVQEDPMSIRNMKNPPESVQKEAVSKNPEAIQYIENPSEDVQVQAVTGFGGFRAIKHIKNLAEKAAIKAVAGWTNYFDYLPEKFKNDQGFIKKLVAVNGDYIAKLHDATFEDWKRAVFSPGRGYLIRQIHDMDMALKLIKSKPSLLEYLSKEHKVASIATPKFINELIDAANINKETSYGDMSWIRAIPELVSGKEKTKLTDRLFDLAPDNTSLLLPKSVKYPPEKVEAFLMKNPDRMHNFGKKNLTDEVMAAVVEKNPRAIMSCTTEMIVKLLKKTPLLLKFINTDRDSVSNKVPKYGEMAMEAAIKTDPHMIKYAKCPDEDLQVWALENGATAEEVWHLQTKYFGIKTMALMLQKKPSLREDLLQRLKKSRMSKKMEAVDKMINLIANPYKVGTKVKYKDEDIGTITDIEPRWVTIKWSTHDQRLEKDFLERYLSNGTFVIEK